MNNTITLRDTIRPKSDQLNADDLVGTERMIQVERVDIINDPQQPVHIYYVGGDGRPFKPCLTVRRILIALWGDNQNDWIGRFMNLYVDPTVSFGNQKNIGGIRVNAVSHIPSTATLKLTVRRGAKKEYVIQPINLEQ